MAYHDNVYNNYPNSLLHVVRYSNEADQARSSDNLTEFSTEVTAYLR
jgi:hypothetical protein